MKYLFIYFSISIFLICCKQKEKNDVVPNFCMETTLNNYACIYIYTDNIVYYPPYTSQVERDSIYLITFTRLIKNIQKECQYNTIYFNVNGEIKKETILKLKKECSLYFSKKIVYDDTDKDNQIRFELIN